MTPKERFYYRLRGENVDKIPNLNIVMLFAAQYCSIPYGKFCKDYRYLVEAQTKTAVDFGIDILSTMSDPFRELYDYGVPMTFPEDNLPICQVFGAIAVGFLFVILFYRGGSLLPCKDTPEKSVFKYEWFIIDKSL